jgi:hypothetical protein
MVNLERLEGEPSEHFKEKTAFAIFKFLRNVGAVIPTTHHIPEDQNLYPINFFGDTKKPGKTGLRKITETAQNGLNTQDDNLQAKTQKNGNSRIRQ